MKQNKNLWRRSLAERVSLTISLSILSLIVALVTYTWITGDNNPPILSVTTAEIREVNQQYYVPFSVKNSGGETAESIEVEGTLMLDEGVMQTGRQQIDFLSRQEVREGEFVFSNNPRQGKLTVRVTSYKLP